MNPGELVAIMPSVSLMPEPLDTRKRAQLERARIDESCRLPVLLFFASSVFWLVVGSLLAIIASIKMHSPDSLFPDSSILTFGRVRPAHLNVVAYGWASMAAIGVAIWLMCRLSRAELPYPKMLVFANILWNLGVFVGTLGILFGFSTSVEWLEFPVVVAPVLTLALSLVAAWTVAVFRNRREKHVYVSQWYIFGAMFWMPWLYTTAAVAILFMPSKGVLQAAANWWYAHNVLGLWLTPIGVGAAYYLIPKVLGRPIYSYHLSLLGFWALALFYSWAGMHHLAGGPIPAWMSTASVVGSVMMFIPVMSVALNHHMTMVGHFEELKYSPTLRFVVFGSITYTIVSFQGSIESLKSFSEIVHFSHYTVGHAHLGAYGFFSMIMFGCMYYIVPRLTSWEWGSSKLIRWHFWTTALGVTLYFLALTVGGWFQGLAMNNPEIPWIRIVADTIPYLQLRTIGGISMTVGHILFAMLFVQNLLKLSPRRTGPAYFTEREPQSGSELKTEN
jgi:cytochrome c oxidase cbb3-type subunit 1